VVLVRMPRALIAAIDRWMVNPGAGDRRNRHRQCVGPPLNSRSAAIRKLIVLALGRA
jgi:hypothetical protein